MKFLNIFRPNTKDRFAFERKVEARGGSVPSSTSNSVLVLRAILTDIALIIALPFFGKQALLGLTIVLVATVGLIVEYTQTLKTWFPALTPELKKEYWRIYWLDQLKVYGTFIAGILLIAVIALILQQLGN